MSFSTDTPVRVICGSDSLHSLHCLLPKADHALVVTDKSTDEEDRQKILRQLALAGMDGAVFFAPSPQSQLAVENGIDIAIHHACTLVIAVGTKDIRTLAGRVAAAISSRGNPAPLFYLATEPLVDFPGRTPFVSSPPGPALTLLDPALIKPPSPSHLLIDGLNILFCCTEYYRCGPHDAFQDMLALCAVQSLSRALPAAVRNPTDFESMEPIVYASALSARFQRDSHLEALGEAVGESGRLPHGLGSILIARAYYAHWLRKKPGTTRFLRLAQAMGMVRAEEPRDFLLALQTLMEDCGLADVQKLTELAFLAGATKTPDFLSSISLLQNSSDIHDYCMSEFGILPDFTEQAVALACRRSRAGGGIAESEMAPGDYRRILLDSYR